MDIDGLISGADKVIAHLKESYTHLQVGRASTSLVEHLAIYVHAWGSTTPLNSLANVTVLDNQTIKIEAYNKADLKTIEKGILDADIGFNPLNQGEYIMIKIPTLTTERRQELTKLVHKEAEEAKIAIRNIRHEARNHTEKLFKDKEISEDIKKSDEKQIDELTKKYNETIEETAKAKTEEVMKV